MLKIVDAKGKMAKKYHLLKGDTILKFDGFDAVDTLDYLFYDSKPNFCMTVQDANGNVREVVVEKDADESLNLTFEQHEEIRTCHNHCIFCFVDQMPEAMRESLYVKDDDYTMSFMCGNFVTLTNLSDAELDRIIRLHLSPLYVSVHTMDEKLRCELLGNRFAGKITQQLKKLAEAKITVHCQAVVVPNKNDGENLAYTAKKLFEMYPYVADLAVVPTGITKYREGLTHIDNITTESAAAVLDLCDSLNKQFGVNFLLPADEYFVRCGREMKDETFYGDFSQIENGIGMTTKFISDFNAAKHPATLKHPKRVAVVTGVSACGTIEKLCQEANKLVTGLHAFALPVVNTFFGDSVTCTGLLTGQDILNELQKNSMAFDSVIIPANTLKQFEDVFLDNMTVKDLQRALKHKKVHINREADTFFESLLQA